MKSIAEANHDIKRNKTKVQFKLFYEQMEYQREKDYHRLYEHLRIAKENARLAIIKRGEILAYLATSTLQLCTMTSFQGVSSQQRYYSITKRSLGIQLSLDPTNIVNFDYNI